MPYRNTYALQKHLDEQEEKQEGHQEKPELIHRGNQRRIHIHDLIRSNRDRSSILTEVASSRPIALALACSPARTALSRRVTIRPDFAIASPLRARQRCGEPLGHAGEAVLEALDEQLVMLAEEIERADLRCEPELDLADVARVPRRGRR
jgi:hypothetical protein